MLWNAMPVCPRKEGVVMGIERFRTTLGLLLVLVAQSRVLAEEKRPLPDYDGRPERTTGGDALLWIPRVVFFPLYFVSEFVLRRPLGWVFTEAEEHHFPRVGTHPAVYVVPSFYFESGFKPSLGVYVFSNRLFSEDNELHARFGSWGLSSPSVGVVDRFRLGPVTLSANLSWANRSDYAFFGLGPSSRQDDRARFHAGRFEAALGVAFELARPVEIAVKAGLRDFDFDEGSCCDDPSLAAQIAAGVFPEPHGFADGVRAFVQRLELTVDSRVPGPWRQSGVRFSAEVEHGSDLKHTDDGWLRYGAKLGGFWDITGRARVLGLELTTRFVRPLSGEVPFTELAALGGAEMVGFPDGRLLGESAVAATLRYEWPVWVWLRGSLTAEVGNVFGRGLDGFEAERLRMSFSVGIGSFGRDQRLQALIGVGTDPFDQGAGVSWVRVSIGGVSGF
jgi:hypothetical protein